MQLLATSARIRQSLRLGCTQERKKEKKEGGGGEVDLVHVALEAIDTNNNVSSHKCITPMFPGEEPGNSQ